MATNVVKPPSEDPTRPALTARQREILAAAEALIARDGVLDLTLRALAAELQVTEPAIYRHFPSKLAILEAILDGFAEDSRQGIAAFLAEPGSASGKLADLVGAVGARFSVRPALAVVVLSGESFRSEPGLTARITEIMEQHLDLAEELIRRGQATGELRDDLPARDLALACLGAARLAVTLWRQHGLTTDIAATTADLGRTVARLLARGSGGPDDHVRRA